MIEHGGAQGKRLVAEQGGLRAVQRHQPTRSSRLFNLSAERTLALVFEVATEQLLLRPLLPLRQGSYALGGSALLPRTLVSRQIATRVVRVCRAAEQIAERRLRRPPRSLARPATTPRSPSSTGRSTRWPRISCDVPRSRSSASSCYRSRTTSARPSPRSVDTPKRSPTAPSPIPYKRLVSSSRRRPASNA